MISITIDDRQLQATLRHLEQAGGDLAPAMRKIAQSLLKVTEDNLAAEGRPKWEALAESTKLARLGGKKAYKKNGELKASAQRQLNQFRILQHTGQLAASISTDYDRTQAIIGSNKVYAAIQHFGGEAGRGHAVTLVARPYLPMDAEGNLQPEAREDVLGTVLCHLQKAAGI
ncbi:phage virion morphogenesis protein [Neisseriaceae bacterium TC5R-5]|nr:phage virion morphogenesis protein [Neisseriaceae bacterium TC5R-5]